MDRSKIVGTSTTDALTALARALAGATPVVGSVLVELIGVTVPNQRLDRIAQFGIALERRLDEHEKALLRGRLLDPPFTDLLEEGVRQAAHSLSDERRGYIAGILKGGLTADQAEIQAQRHLLRLLGEINDVEVLIVVSHSHNNPEDGAAFRAQHRAVLAPQRPTLSGPSADKDRFAVHQGYLEHLCSIGLLRKIYRTDPNTRQLTTRGQGGALEASRLEITNLGRLLARTLAL